MDINMFLVFPGILITIGVFLLLLSIIMVIIAYKTSDKPEKNYFSINEDTSTKDKTSKEEVKEILSSIENKDIEKNKDKDETKNKEESLEETKIFRFPLNNRDVSINEIDNEVSNRLSKMKQEMAKELDILENTKDEEQDMFFDSKRETNPFEKLRVEEKEIVEEEEIELL